MMPNWKAEKRDNEKERELHSCIKSAINSWIELPEPIDLEQIRPGEYSNSNKFITYPISL
jgi:hypothetical protein